MTLKTFVNIALLVFAFAVLGQAIWIGLHWFGDTLTQKAALIWSGVLIGLTVVMAISVFLLRKRIWIHDPVTAQWAQLKRAARHQFDLAHDRARVIDVSPDVVPWYLFIANEKPERSTAMVELGYVSFGNPLQHDGLSISTWASPTAIAYRIEISASSDTSFDFIGYVLELLFQNRPSLAVNAGFVECDLAGLMQTGGEENSSVSVINRILNVAAFEFGIDIPVHIILVGLEHFLDLSRSAILTQKIGNTEIFGGFLPHEGHNIEARIDALFEDLIKALNAARLPALRRQLVPEFCASLLNGPIQLALLQIRLRDRAVALTQPLPPRRRPLDLHSVAFAGALETMPAVDPLSQVVGQRYFGAPIVSTHAEAKSSSVTIDNSGLLAQAYHREGFLVKPNLRRQVQTGVRRSIWSLALACVVVVFGALLLDNFVVYSRVNDSLDAAFNAYYDDIGTLGSNSDVLVERVLRLQPLRAGLEDYQAVSTTLHRRLLPNWSLEDTFQKLYDQELVEGLQAALINYLEKEIFAFNSLGDGVELIRLASVEAQLHANQQTYSQELTSFFQEGLAAQGEISNEFQTRFRLTLQDLFTLDQPPAIRNENLLAVVAKTLSGLNTADLLYLSLMRKPAYAERVDLRRLLGPHAVEVFTPPPDAQTYLVARAYTQDGFNSLFKDGQIPELGGMIRNYEDIIGRLDEAEINAITRKVAQSYTSDYIAYWTSFIEALSLREIDGWADAQIMMKALTSPADNPLTRLSQAMQVNLDIPVWLPAAAATSADLAGTPEPDARIPAMPTANSEAATAFNIRSAFRPYLEAAELNAEDRNQYDVFLQYAADVNLWLEAAAGAANGTGSYLFEQFQAPDQASPLATFNAFVVRSDIDLIRNFGRNLSAKLDAQAMHFIYDYIDRQWKQEILVPHGAALENSFPFASGSDISLIEFADLFAPEGKLLNFELTYLARFRAADGTYRPRPTFLLSGSAEPLVQARQAFIRFSQISETMFVDGRPYFAFNIRTGYLENALSKLSISSGVTLHQYSHGPVFWAEQTWPAAGIQDSALQLRLYQRSRAVLNVSYTGPWSWFRLARSGNTILNPSLGLAEATFAGNDGVAKLHFEVQQRHNPFAPGFFSNFDLPISLFVNDRSPASDGGVSPL
jgi:type VI secretion system protein ImpL